MSEIVKKLRERRLKVWEEAKAIAERATDENRKATPEEQGQWDGLNGELETLDKRIKSALDTEARAKEAEETFDKLEKRPQERKGQEESKSPELRAFLRGEGPRSLEIKPSGTEFRTLSKLSAGAGANAVPTNFYDRLVAHLIETSAVLQAGVTVLNTSGGETIQVPKTTGHSSAVIVAEAAALTASDPVFGQASLGAYKYGTLIQVSRELLDDTGVDLEGYLAMQAGRALGNAFGAHLVTGTGSSQPSGVVTGSSAGVTGGASVSGAFTADNIIDLQYSVIAPYRSSQACAWMMRDATIASIRKLKDTTGQYLWQPSMQVGAPDMLLGKPVFTDPNVAAVALSAKSVLFGDFSQYFVRLAGGVRFERSDDYAFNTDLVTFRALLRGDGVLVDQTGAVKHFVGNAA
jgi:HK97 family phage major capsid protein